MRRSATQWASQQLSRVAASAAGLGISTPSSLSSSTLLNSSTGGGGGLFFADRAVKMTHAAPPGCSFRCTPAVLSCEGPEAFAAVRLAREEGGGGPLAVVELQGSCAVSLFRGRRLAFHCHGELARQRHELSLREGDILALLGGGDLRCDWRAVDQTLRGVAQEDLEYIAEEMLLKLGHGTGTAANTNKENCEKGRSSNGTCIMTVVLNQPSGLIPQPPASLQCSVL